MSEEDCILNCHFVYNIKAQITKYVNRVTCKSEHSSLTIVIILLKETKRSEDQSGRTHEERRNVSSKQVIGRICTHYIRHENNIYQSKLCIVVNYNLGSS
jgi:hypothetical protein